MKVLVTGGTGVVGAGVIPALLNRGHSVRLISRNAHRDSYDLPKDLETVEADVTDPGSLEKVAEGCNCVLHITGIVQESPPKTTFEAINVQGTANMLKVAERVKAGRFVFLSSLGADTGKSEYHKSKRRAEELVRKYPEWAIVRPGNVFGPGDEVISLLLKMVRTLPAIPMVGDGKQPFEPIWYKDLGQALARVVDLQEAANRVLEVTGGERTSTDDLLQRLERITGKQPVHIPVPEWLSKVGTSMAEALGFHAMARGAGLVIPGSTNQVQMLLDENVIHAPEGNALTSVLGVTPAPLDEALTELADSLPELLPEEGVGTLEHKQFVVEIRGAKMSAADLMRKVRAEFAEIIPVEMQSEPGTPSEAGKGETLTGAIPGRGNFQVRVLEVTANSVKMATVQGHPLAGLVSFKTADADGMLRFSIETHARAANAVDWVALAMAGSWMQDSNWKEMAERVVRLSGGKAPDGVQTSKRELSREEAEGVNEQVKRLVAQAKRE